MLIENCVMPNVDITYELTPRLLQLIPLNSKTFSNNNCNNNDNVRGLNLHNQNAQTIQRSEILTLSTLNLHTRQSTVGQRLRWPPTVFALFSDSFSSSYNSAQVHQIKNTLFYYLKNFYFYFKCFFFNKQ